jgi:hypothetical protein
MKFRTIQNQLKNCSKEELVQMFLELAKRNPAAEHFLISRFDPTAPEPDFADYKAQVRSEFFPARGFGDGNPSIAFRMLQRVETEATSPRQVIDFIYFCVETGVEFTEAYGDIDEEFYAAFEDLFERAAKLALTNGLSADYSDRARCIVTSTFEMGWGLYDELEHIFTEYFAAGSGG